VAGVTAGDDEAAHEDELDERVRESEEQLEEAERRLEEVEEQIEHARETVDPDESPPSDT
jgi:DNA repair exonuclease SbcCD ATPase subunit